MTLPLIDELAMKAKYGKFDALLHVTIGVPGNTSCFTVALTFVTKLDDETTAGTFEYKACEQIAQ